MPTEHVPVLAAELIGLLDPQPGEIAVDCTFGGGGHARLVADRIGPTGVLHCIDLDPAAEERFRAFEASGPACEARFIRGGYAEALDDLRDQGVEADLVYLDLGMSSLQLDTWERGFSYAYDAPLDMRMDPGQELSAREVVNEWPQDRLVQVLRDYGEERYAGAIAREIIRRRPLETTAELVETIKAAIPPAARFGRGHPAKRSFQAIRIVVNDELDSLDRALPEAWSLLRHGGRLGAISFHSLEDRRVKRFLAERAKGCICPPELPVCRCGRKPEAELLSRRAVSASAGEVAQNPRSKAARLRAAVKVGPARDTI
jgi:16S rRNA (cytosine1402-N4)-methyltransferase